MDPDTLEHTLHIPDGLEADNSALVKWSTKTVDELVAAVAERSLQKQPIKSSLLPAVKPTR